MMLNPFPGFTEEEAGLSDHSGRLYGKEILEDTVSDQKRVGLVN